MRPERRGLTPGQRHLPATAQIVLSAGFCLLLALPALILGRGWASEDPASRKRPSFSRSRYRFFPREFESYFNGSFGLRGPLVRLHNTLRVFGLRTAPLPQVVLGRAGWLYYDGDPVGDGVSLADFRGEALYPPGTADLIAVKVATQAKWLADRGIPYAVVVGPNKESIYPDFLPDSAGPPGGRTRLDQVSEALSRHDLPIVDPRGALLAAKQLGPLYFKTDTHWTPLGALIAYRELIGRLREVETRLVPVRLEDYTVRALPSTDRVGDIAWLLSLGGRFTDWDAVVEPRDPSWPGEQRLGKVLLFRDSFGEALVPFLRRHFREVTAVPGPISFGKIEEEKPDVVLFEVAERYLKTLQRSKTPPGTGSEPAAQPASADPAPASGMGSVIRASGRAPGPGGAGPAPLRQDGAGPRG